MHYPQVTRDRLHTIFVYLAIAALLLLGNIAQSATMTSFQSQKPARVFSSCAAPVSILAHKTLVQVAGLEDKKEFDEAFQLTLQTANSIDPNCRTRAALETTAASIKFRLGELTEAQQLSAKALNELHRFEDESEDIGVAEYLLGAVSDARGKIAEAEHQYLKAAHVFRALGNRSALRLARVYSDLAMLNLRANDLRHAELYLQKAIDSERLVKDSDTMERLARLDAVVHLSFKKGEYTEANRLNGLLLQAYATDMRVPAALRAHIYADRGGLMYATGHYAECLLNLNKSLDLYRMDAGNSETIAVTLAMAARAHIGLKDLVSAQMNIEEALQRGKTLRANYPLGIAFIEETYGDYLALNRQWAEARAQYLDSISLFETIGEGKRELTACLFDAATADDHLRRRRESKTLRKQAQSIIATLHTPGDGATVDLATLEAGKH